MQGFMVGYNGSKIFCLHVYSMSAVEVPQVHIMLSDGPSLEEMMVFHVMMMFKHCQQSVYLKYLGVHLYYKDKKYLDCFFFYLLLRSMWWRYDFVVGPFLFIV